MRRRHRAALAGAGVVFLISTLYVTATRQSAVEARARALLADTLHAPCTFDEARFSFLEGLTVRGLRVLDPEDPLRPPLVSVGDARLDFHLDLLGAGPRLTVIHLRSPTVRVTADREGRPSLLSIARVPESGAASVEPPVIRITDGTVVLDGPPALAPGETVTLTSIRADVLLTGGTVRVPAGHARADALGPVEYRLDATPDRGTVSVALDAAEIDIERFARESSLSAITGPLTAHQVRGSVAVHASLVLRRGAISDLAVDVDVADAAGILRIPEAEGLPPPEPLAVALSTARVSFRDGRATVEDAHGVALGAPLAITGFADLGSLLGMAGHEDAQVDLEVALEGAHVGPDVQGHFPLHLREIRETYGLSGVADARVRVHGALEEPAVDAVLDVREVSATYFGHLDEATGRRQGFPWRTDGLSGRVTVEGPRVEFAAEGRHGSAAVTVRGYHQAEPGSHGRTEVRVDARDVPLDDDLYAAFGDRAERTLGPWRPAGVAGRVEVLVEESPEVAGGATGTHVTAHLDGRAEFTPHVLPARLTGAEGVVRILEPEVDGRRVSRVELEGVRAAADGFTLRGATGRVQDDDEDVHVQLDVDRLDGAFRDAVLASSTLTDGVRRSLRLLAPRGRAALDVRVRSTGGVRGDEVVATLRGVDVQGWEGVPLAVRALEGDVRYQGDALTTDGLSGEILGGSAVHVAGSLTSLSDPEPVPSLRITAEDVVLDTRLRDALGTLAAEARAVWDELAPSNDLRADVDARVLPPGAPGGRFSFELSGLHGGLRVLGLPLELDSGRASYEDTRRTVEGSSLVASRGSGSIAVERFTYDTATADLDVLLAARNLTFPDDLVPLLSPAGADTIRGSLAPSRLHLPRLHLAWDASERHLHAEGAATLRVTPDGLNAPGLHVRSEIALESADLWLPEGADAEVVGTARLTDTSLDPGVTLTELSGPVAFRGSPGADPGTFELDLAGGRARLMDLLLDDLGLRMEVEGSRLRIPEVQAGLYGGRLTGRFNRGGERLEYRGAFEIAGGDLSLYAKDQQRDPMSGTVDAELRFRNPGGPDGELEGSGEAVIEGAEIRVPWISASLRAVDDALLGVAAIEGDFHQGRIEFDLRGQRALIRALHFVGPSVPLLLGATLELQDGRGAIDMVDGRLDLVVYPRLRFGVLGLDPTGIFDRLVGAAQFMVRRLRIEGSTRNPRARWEVFSGEIADEFARRPRPIGEVRPYGPEPW